MEQVTETREKNTGSLSEKGLMELITEWYKRKKSGALYLKRKQYEKFILFHEGAIVRAQSNQDQERLGQILIKKELIKPWDVEVALSQLPGSNKRIGQVFLQMKALKEAALNQTLVSQTRDIIFSMLDWEDGEYSDQNLPGIDKEVPLDQISTAEIILQGIRKITNLNTLSRIAGDIQAKLRLSHDYLEKIRKVTLLTEEKSILALLHKPSSLKDLNAASGMEKLAIYRSVAGMLAVGLLNQDGVSDSGNLGAAVSPIQTNPASKLQTGPQDSVSSSGSRRKTHRQLGELLVEHKVVTEEQLKEALKAQVTSTGKKQFLGNVLVQMGFVAEEAIIECLSTQLNIKKVESINAEQDAVRAIPFHLAKKYFVCPIRKDGSFLEVAMLDPTNMLALDDLSFVTGYKIKPFLADNKCLKDAWETSYSQVSEEKSVEKYEKKDDHARRGEIGFRDFTGVHDDDENSIENFLAEGEADDSYHFDMVELEKMVSGVVDDLAVVDESANADNVSVEDAPIVKLVNTIMRQAIEMGSSDIHIEPWETKLHVRFRLDGELHKVMSFPVTIANALISRIKILSQMDIAERRRPQDGRIKLRMGKKRNVDYRISTVPTVYGERMVMRVLDKATLQLDLAKLGFDSIQLEAFRKSITQPYGMILCTGPTGSGKTTTLYSALASLDKNLNNIITAEDPVEYNFPGISQIQVNEQIGVTFANVLRSFLRQDPDVILVGEIRDAETAEISAKASLTGHLVFSTVHTNDAPSAIGRLVDLGLKPYLVAASLLMVIAQRLLRKICTRCKMEGGVDKKVLLDAGFLEDEAETMKIYKGAGCESCGKTGFMGRTAIYELMPVSRKIKAAIASDLPADQIKEIAVNEGMKDLRRAALEKVLAGVTTLEEALQNTLAD